MVGPCWGSIIVPLRLSEGANSSGFGSVVMRNTICCFGGRGKQCPNSRSRFDHLEDRLQPAVPPRCSAKSPPVPDFPRCRMHSSNSVCPSKEIAIAVGIEIEKLSVAEKVELLESVWESLALTRVMCSLRSGIARCWTSGGVGWRMGRRRYLPGLMRRSA